MSAETTGQASGGGTTEYINHHLHHLQWNFGDGKFWTVNLDTIFFTVVLSALVLFFFIRAARQPELTPMLQTKMFIVAGLLDAVPRAPRPISRPAAMTVNFNTSAMRAAFSMVYSG